MAATRGLNLRRDDPLRYRRLSSLGQRDLFRHVAQGHEVYAHAGNAAGKTEGACDLALRFCQGRRRVDARLMTRPGETPDELSTEPCWIDLPAGATPGNPWRHWCLVTSYGQAKDSSVKAFRKLIGRWPHEIAWVNKREGTVKMIRVMPEGGNPDDSADWSEITFITQENMTEEDVRFIRGARVNSVQADEAPLEFVWREVRARGEGNLTLYRWIAYTPEKKSEWEWIFEDFRGCFNTPTRGRVRIQWSVEDNRALSAETLAKKREGYEGDDLFDARWNGEHVDVSGRCPFHKGQLKLWLARCQPGRMERIVLRSAPTDPDELDDRDFLPEEAWIERWLPYEKGRFYVATIDPSRGIDDADHDPCELEVWEWDARQPLLAARFGMRDGVGGYLDGDSLGILADLIGRQYGNALMDVETNGGFGDPVLLALRKRRYPNLAHDDVTDTPGKVLKGYGWNTGPGTRSEIVSALQERVKADSCRVWSKDVVLQLADVQEAPDGKAIAKRGKRHHAEAMITAGRALHLIATKRAPTYHVPKAKSDMAEALRRSMGRKVIPRRGRKRFAESFSGAA